VIRVLTHRVGLPLHFIDDILATYPVQPQDLDLLSANDRDVAVVLVGHRFPLLEGGLVVSVELRESRHFVRLVPRPSLRIPGVDLLELLK
jgi:hypothetical protein